MTVTLDNTIGAIFLGISVASIIFGMTLVQTHLYYHKFPKDSMLQKVSVGILMTLAALHLTFTFHAVYYYLITSFDHPEGLESIIWSFQSQMLVSAVMIIFVQGLYTHRIWKLGRHFSRFWPALVGLIITGQWALGFVTIVKSYEEKRFAALGGIHPIIFASFTLATVIDLMITSAMYYYLNKSQSSFVGTKNKILIIMRYVLLTGALTSACTLASLITFAAMPNNFVFMGIGFLLPYLYVNSYIGLLNARTSINKQEASSAEVSAATNVRSGLAYRMDGENIESMDDKMHSDGICLSSMRFNPGISNKYDPEQDILSKRIEVVVQRTEERQYDQYEISE